MGCGCGQATQESVIVCNVCGGKSFGPGPGGRMTPQGKPPTCSGCGSLERHRAIRAFVAGPQASYKSWRVLQFSPDVSVDPKWFKSYEVTRTGEPGALDMQRIARPDASYELVLANHVLEHVKDDRAALRELVRVLSPAGKIVLTVPDPARRVKTESWEKPDAHGHYRLYGRDIVRFIAETVKNVRAELIPIKDPVTGEPDVAVVIQKT